MGVSPLVGVLVVGALVNAALAVVGYRRREVTAATPFVFLTVGIALWAGLDAIQYSVTSPGLVSLFTRVSYAGNTLTPYAAFVTLVVYTGHDDWLTRPVTTVLVVLPATLFVLALTTPAHGLMWGDLTVVLTEPVTVTEASTGPAFWFHLVSSYCMLAVVIVLLIRMIRNTVGRQQWQAVLVFAATVVPVVGNVMWLLG